MQKSSRRKPKPAAIKFSEEEIAKIIAEDDYPEVVVGRISCRTSEQKITRFRYGNIVLVYSENLPFDEISITTLDPFETANISLMDKSYSVKFPPESSAIDQICDSFLDLIRKAYV